ncbi:D-alanine--poly(phosphoribitol) ligase subunit DltC [Clostridiaceae bacterium]|nr:D-alanine--poly(phosphoribitol) ligase subunit DltC [Clostridium sp.]NBI72667.1 D-alanine--poly(phosphoribitol) ligase subunit DltC [Clostridiaceae bacterium]
MEEKILDMLAEVCEDDMVREDRGVRLFETGLLDSLTFAELLFEIEDRFGLILPPSEIGREDVDTPEKIIGLIRGRLER